MKNQYLFSALIALMSLGLVAQNTVVTDPSSDGFIAFANVFDLPADGGAFIFGSPWGVPDVQTVVDAGTGVIVLQPNFNTYADNPTDPFWVNQDTGEGNKLFSGSTFLESTDLVGQELTFTGGVLENTLDPSYVAVAFIRVFNADFSVLKEVTSPLVEGQDFSITFTDIAPEDTTVQYGWEVFGVNANPADEGTLGSIVLGPTVLGVNDVIDASIAIFPNPSTSIWNVSANTPIESIAIVNVLGQRVSFETPNTTNVSIANSHLTTGMYTATITTAEGSKTTKLIKK